MAWCWCRAIAVNETVVEVFDPLCRDGWRDNPPRPAMLDQGFDRAMCPVSVHRGYRWELSADMLELRFDPQPQFSARSAKVTTASCDRRSRSPARRASVLFNRWIVPMDSQQFTGDQSVIARVPFDLVLVFSTNLRRRTSPTRLSAPPRLQDRNAADQPDEYRQIWQRVCAERSAGYDGGLADRREQHHRRRNVPLLPCHPQDLVGMALDRVTYLGRPSGHRLLRWAWDCYFLHRELNEFGRTESTGVVRMFNHGRS
jgi:hypothetical protein